MEESEGQTARAPLRWHANLKRKFLYSAVYNTRLDAESENIDRPNLLQHEKKYASETSRHLKCTGSAGGETASGTTRFTRMVGLSIISRTRYT